MLTELPVAAVHGFGAKPGGPGDAAGRRVAHGGDDLEAFQAESSRAHAAEQREGAPRYALAAARGAHPVAEAAVGIDGVDAQQVDRADDLAGGGVVDRQVSVAAVAPGFRVSPIQATAWPKVYGDGMPHHRLISGSRQAAISASASSTFQGRSTTTPSARCGTRLVVESG